MQPAPQPPPHAPLLELTVATVVGRALYAVTERGIPDLLTEGPRTPDELAAKVGVQPIPLIQLLRALAAAGIFTHEADGRFGLTPVSETLVTGHPTAAREMVLTLGGPAFWAALGVLPEVLETGRTGVEIALGTSFFDYIRQHPEEEASSSTPRPSLKRPKTPSPPPGSKGAANGSGATSSPLSRPAGMPASSPTSSTTGTSTPATRSCVTAARP